MPNIAAFLKAEIARIARKEIRAEISQLKKSVGSHRSALALLKRQATALEKGARALKGATPRSREPVSAPDGDGLRFSAKAFAAQRRRLALSASACGLLLGTSGQSVYNWEQGKSRPLKRYLAAIGALKTLSKQDAAAIAEARASAT